MPKTSLAARRLDGLVGSDDVLNRNKSADRTNIHIDALIEELRRFQSTRDHVKARIKALMRFGHLTYCGGNVVEQYMKRDDRIIDSVIVSMVNRLEPLALRMQAVQTMTVMCQGGKLLQEIMLEKRVMDMLVRLLADRMPEMWAVYGIFLLAVKNFDKYMQQLLSPSLAEQLDAMALMDWSEWPNNQAQELRELIRLLSRHA
ncbi:hypothetical protein BC831DRAFT_255407 [Entophlyctis helioformis]|nr:hypothetical protein BC831DRAFT_255407 [Entophlyctis helioformis]